MDVRMTKLGGLGSLLLIALAPAAAVADDYQFEVRGGFDHLGSDTDIDVASLGGTWYFAPVSTNNVPLAEAAYLGRASFLGGGLALMDFLDTTLDAEDVKVGYYIPGTMFYAAVGALHEQNIIAFSSTFTETRYDTRWFGTLGIAPLDGLLVTTDFHEYGYDPNITARYVGKLPNNHFYAGSVTLADIDYGETAYGLDFDYYFDDSTSVGVGFDGGGGRFDSDARFVYGGNRLELRAEKFFSKSWAAGVSAYTSDFHDGFSVHVTWRH